MQDSLVRRANRASLRARGSQSSPAESATPGSSAGAAPDSIAPDSIAPDSIAAAARDAAASRANSLRARDFDAMPAAKLERRIARATGRAVADFKLIEEGDRILVAISGGKDSWALLRVLDKMRKRAPFRFELVAANIDQGYAGFRQDAIEDYVAARGYEYHMEYFNIAKLIEEKTAPGSTPCALCSRMRRGALYGLAEKHGCNKIALGHHLDDFIETALLNMLFVGRLAAMAPKLLSDDGKNVVIRPLVYVEEKEIRAYAQKMHFPIVCCQCPIMCGETVHGDYKRRMLKKLIDELEVAIPGVRHSLIASLGNAQPSHLLDRDLYDFALAAQADRAGAEAGSAWP
jgi:tRNA 2-thiocytidine biosynthesis protein TtcA